MGRLGTMEILVVIIIALVIFGPGKLPELGKMLGKAIGSIKHYSDPATWEKQAEKEDNDLKMSEVEAQKKAAAVAGDGAAASGLTGGAADSDGSAAVCAEGASAGGAVMGTDPAAAAVDTDTQEAVKTPELVIDVGSEMPEEDAAAFANLEGKSIDEIASEVLNSGKEVNAE